MLSSGDTVFFCTNSAVTNSFHAAAFNVIQSLALVPVTYAGAGLEISKSNLDREIREDFYKARLIVLFLESGQSRPIADNWALAELQHRPNISLIVYATAGTPKMDIDQLHLPESPIFVGDEAEFMKDFRRRIEQLM